MKIIISIIAFISIAGAASIPDEAQAQIIKYSNKNDGKGNYLFSYETSNGLIREETGKLINAGQPDEHTEILGSYSYTDTNGQKVEIKYIADENGYHIIKESGAPVKQPVFNNLRFVLPKGLLDSLL